ncbi:hypothetical protein GC163_20445 [bacterium]|nr:hypothetical protein [bacterium]
MTVVPLEDIITELTNVREGGMTISVLANLRHKLTANIKVNLYGGGTKTEGRRALAMRNRLDENIYTITAADTVDGNVEGIEHLKRAIALENLAEQLDILIDMSRKANKTGKGMKSEMIDILSDSDRFGRFVPAHQKLMKDAAAGMSIFAHWKFNKLFDSIQAQANTISSDEQPVPNKQQPGDTGKPNILIILPMYFLMNGEEPFADMVKEYDDPKQDAISVYTAIYKVYCYNKRLLEKFGKAIYHSTIIDKQREKLAATSLETSEQFAGMMKMFHDLDELDDKDDVPGSDVESAIACALIVKEPEFTDVKDDERRRVEWMIRVAAILREQRAMIEKYFENCWNNGGFNRNELEEWLTKA